jgi:DNA-3-methyladenine glycosylase II
MARVTTTQHTATLQRGLAHVTTADPLLADIHQRFGPLTWDVDDRLFRTLVSSIVSQQLSGAGAAAIMRRVEALFEGGVVQPDGLAAQPFDTLRAAGLSRAKVASLHDLAAHVLDGRLALDQLHSLSDEEVIGQLIAVRGIGRWTAHMFLMFSLMRPDVLPEDDYGVRKAVKLTYSLPDMPTKQQMRTIAEPWRPYATIASLLLWASLDNRPN